MVDSQFFYFYYHALQGSVATDKVHPSPYVHRFGLFRFGWICHALFFIAFKVYFWPVFASRLAQLAACLLERAGALKKTIPDFPECYNTC